MLHCFYHADLDGKCAGWAVHAWVGIKPNKDGTIGAKMHEINYNKPFPFEEIRPDDQVWIVDFSISPNEMLRLLEITKDITWIDHHQTAIDKYSDFPHPIRGIRKNGEAGCMLTFKYIHWWTPDRGEGEEDFTKQNEHIPIPLHVALVEDWDLFKFSYGDKTRWFKEGCEMEDTSPSSELWWNLLIVNTNIESIINNGKTAIKYRSQWAKEFMKSWAFPIEFEGHKCIAANLGKCNSEYFKSIEDGYDILMPFIFDGAKWTVSLYSKTVDVSEIAKKYGGGGHKGASGFQCLMLPFLSMPVPKD